MEKMINIFGNENANKKLMEKRKTAEYKLNLVLNKLAMNGDLKTLKELENDPIINFNVTYAQKELAAKNYRNNLIYAQIIESELAETLKQITKTTESDDCFELFNNVEKFRWLYISKAPQFRELLKYYQPKIIKAIKKANLENLENAI